MTNSDGFWTVFICTCGRLRLGLTLAVLFTSKEAGSKKTCTKDIFFSALSSPKAKGETASLSFGSSFGFPRIALAGAKLAFFAPRMREKSFRWQETLGLVGASKRNESKPKTNQGSLPAKPIGEGLKDGRCKVDRALVV
uniref:60S ribosomal protein L2, mitochondrial-like n=1 Tax=Nicotiana tabacum TaxID=4097 RepID=A0A1S4BNJ0_TOBAC|nr:PREDICTED: 60S ribosomal protein L2, mitochondrial-like [Nicotiana tabacum]